MKERRLQYSVFFYAVKHTDFHFRLFTQHLFEHGLSKACCVSNAESTLYKLCENKYFCQSRNTAYI